MGQKEKFESKAFGNYALAFTSESQTKYFALSPCTVHEPLLHDALQLLRASN